MADTSQQVMSPQGVYTVPFSGEPKDWPDWSFRFEALAAQLGFLDLITGKSAKLDDKYDQLNKKAY